MSLENPRVDSFVLRFVRDAADDGAPSPHGGHVVVLHIQSNQEKIFTQFADAVAFMSRYVPIGDFAFSKTTTDH